LSETTESHKPSQAFSDGDLPDRCFAYVPDPETPSTRKLKLCGTDGKYDAGIIGAAKAALGKGYRGNRVQLPATARSGVIAKVNAAAKSVGLDPIGASDYADLAYELAAALDVTAAFDEPDSSDVHIDGAIGSVATGAAMRGLNTMRARLKGKLRHGVTIDHAAIDEAHGYARKRVAAMAASEEGVTPFPDPDDDDFDGDDDETPEGYAELAAKPDYRLFQELKSAAEIPARIPYLPIPGTYKHPSYGEVAITPERNARFVANFRNRVYGQDIPIDAEHQTKLSGAMGHIKELVQNSDGSVDAIPTWTPNGQKLLADGAFKYFSPEWFDSWRNPADGVLHQDVPIGGALTNRPFFKEGALRPLAASEGHLYLVTHAERGAATELVFDEFDLIAPANRQGESSMAEEQTSTAAAPIGMTEDQVREFSELKSAFQASEAARIAAESKAEQATKLAEKLDADARRKRFTDEVMGRSDASHLRWFGEPAKHVAFLEAIAEKFGEDSEQVTHYVANERAHAEQLKASNLFKTFGTDADGASGTSALDQINAKAKTYAEEHKVSAAIAFTEVCNQEPALYEAYQAERKGR
jgi:hypothetical protein